MPLKKKRARPRATPAGNQAAQLVLERTLQVLAAYARAAGLTPSRFARLAARAAARRPPAPRAQPLLPPAAGLRIIGRWLTDPAYARAGKPRPLPFSGRRSFTSLVRAARGGGAGTARDALAAAGVVRTGARQRLYLLQHAYIPAAGSAGQAEMFAHMAADFFRAWAHNRAAPAGEKFLQRYASYDNIGGASVMTLRRRLRREGERALQRANALLAARDRDRNPRAPGGRRTRVSFGVYYAEEPSRPRTQKGRG